MWISLTDCAKQIVPHCKLRESNADDIKIYEIIMIEFDQYELLQLSHNGVAPPEEVAIRLDCEQLLQFGFEVETGT